MEVLELLVVRVEEEVVRVVLQLAFIQVEQVLLYREALVEVVPTVAVATIMVPVAVVVVPAVLEGLHLVEEPLVTGESVCRHQFLARL